MSTRFVVRRKSMGGGIPSHGWVVYDRKDRTVGGVHWEKSVACEWADKLNTAALQAANAGAPS